MFHGRRYRRRCCCLAIVSLLFCYLYFSKQIRRHILTRELLTFILPNTQNTIDDSVIIAPSRLHPKLDLLILISSNPHDVSRAENRMAIRNTWGNCNDRHLHFDCQLVFFVGKTYTDRDAAIMREASENQDMFICNMNDTYQSITRKLMCVFKWANQGMAEYILKTDDDIYVQMPALVSYLHSQPRERYYGGVVYSGDVVRDPRHKHYLHKDTYKADFFPPFCKGAMYVISGDLMDPLLKASEQVKRFFIDDAYIGVLMMYLSVTPVSIEGFYQHDFLPAFVDLISDCSLLHLFGVSDALTADNIYYIHQRVLRIHSQNNWCISFSNFLALFVVSTVLGIVIMFLKIKYMEHTHQR